MCTNHKRIVCLLGSEATNNAVSYTLFVRLRCVVNAFWYSCVGHFVRRLCVHFRLFIYMVWSSIPLSCRKRWKVAWPRRESPVIPAEHILIFVSERMHAAVTRIIQWPKRCSSPELWVHFNRSDSISDARTQSRHWYSVNCPIVCLGKYRHTHEHPSLRYNERNDWYRCAARLIVQPNAPNRSRHLQALAVILCFACWYIFYRPIRLSFGARTQCRRILWMFVAQM